MGFVVSKFLYMPPKPSTYDLTTFPYHLCFIPLSPAHPIAQTQSTHIPCLFFSRPGAKRFVLYLHANATDLGGVFLESCYLSHYLNAHLLVPEYPSYGLFAATQPTQENCINTVLTVFDFIKDVMKIDLNRVILYGRSLGTGISSQVAHILTKKFPNSLLVNSRHPLPQLLPPQSHFDTPTQPPPSGFGMNFSGEDSRLSLSIHNADDPSPNPDTTNDKSERRGSDGSGTALALPALGNVRNEESHFHTTDHKLDTSSSKGRSSLTSNATATPRTSIERQFSTSSTSPKPSPPQLQTTLSSSTQNSSPLSPQHGTSTLTVATGKSTTFQSPPTPSSSTSTNAPFEITEHPHIRPHVRQYSTFTNTTRSTTTHHLDLSTLKGQFSAQHSTHHSATTTPKQDSSRINVWSASGSNSTESSARHTPRAQHSRNPSGILTDDVTATAISTFPDNLSSPQSSENSDPKAPNLPQPQVLASTPESTSPSDTINADISQQPNLTRGGAQVDRTVVTNQSDEIKTPHNPSQIEPIAELTPSSRFETTQESGENTPQVETTEDWDFFDLQPRSRGHQVFAPTPTSPQPSTPPSASTRLTQPQQPVPTPISANTSPVPIAPKPTTSTTTIRTNFSITPLAGLILHSPFLSVNDIIRSAAYSSFLLQDHYCTKEVITSISCPTLFIHGMKDRLIPYSHSQQLMSLSAGVKKRLFLSPNSDHNRFSYRDEVIKPIDNFIRQYCTIVHSELVSEETVQTEGLSSFLDESSETSDNLDEDDGDDDDYDVSMSNWDEIDESHNVVVAESPSGQIGQTDRVIPNRVDLNDKKAAKPKEEKLTDLWKNSKQDDNMIGLNIKITNEMKSAKHDEEIRLALISTDPQSPSQSIITSTAQNSPLSPTSIQSTQSTQQRQQQQQLKKPRKIKQPHHAATPTSTVHVTTINTITTTSIAVDEIVPQIPKDFYSPPLSILNYTVTIQHHYNLFPENVYRYYLTPYLTYIDKITIYNASHLPNQQSTKIPLTPTHHYKSRPHLLTTLNFHGNNTNEQRDEESGTVSSYGYIGTNIAKAHFVERYERLVTEQTAIRETLSHLRKKARENFSRQQSVTLHASLAPSEKDKKNPPEQVGPVYRTKREEPDDFDDIVPPSPVSPFGQFNTGTSSSHSDSVSGLSGQVVKVNKYDLSVSAASSTARGKPMGLFGNELDSDDDDDDDDDNGNNNEGFENVDPSRNPSSQFIPQSSRKLQLSLSTAFKFGSETRPSTQTPPQQLQIDDATPPTPTNQHAMTDSPSNFNHPGRSRSVFASTNPNIPQGSNTISPPTPSRFLTRQRSVLDSCSDDDPELRSGSGNNENETTSTATRSSSQNSIQSSSKQDNKSHSRLASNSTTTSTQSSSQQPESSTGNDQSGSRFFSTVWTSFIPKPSPSHSQSASNQPYISTHDTFSHKKPNQGNTVVNKPTDITLQKYRAFSPDEDTLQFLLQNSTAPAVPISNQRPPLSHNYHPTMFPHHDDDDDDDDGVSGVRLPGYTDVDAFEHIELNGMSQGINVEDMVLEDFYRDGCSSDGSFTKVPTRKHTKPSKNQKTSTDLTRAVAHSIAVQRDSNTNDQSPTYTSSQSIHSYSSANLSDFTADNSDHDHLHDDENQGHIYDSDLDLDLGNFDAEGEGGSIYQWSSEPSLNDNNDRTPNYDDASNPDDDLMNHDVDLAQAQSDDEEEVKSPLRVQEKRSSATTTLTTTTTIVKNISTSSIAKQ